MLLLSVVHAGGATAAVPQPVAEAALRVLAAKRALPPTGFALAAFGRAWADVDRNGCDTRNDVLRRDLINYAVQYGTRGCVVLRGTLREPYTRNTIGFVRGVKTSAAVRIDHVVSLADAWQTGARAWSPAKRTALANDSLNLLAVDGPTSLRKLGRGAASWLPPNRAFRCLYVGRQIAVKRKYGLWVTGAERDAMRRVLATCPARRLPVVKPFALGGGIVIGAPAPLPPPLPLAAAVTAAPLAAAVVVPAPPSRSAPGPVAPILVTPSPTPAAPPPPVPSPSTSPTATPSATPSASPTASPSATPTPSPSATPTPSPTQPPIGGPPTQVHLSWTQSPSTSLTVVWKTATTAASSTVEYRLAGTSTWLKSVGSLKSSGTSGTLHVATMSGLSPGKTYDYRVPGDGGSRSPTYKAKTAPGSGSSFSVVLFADTGIEGRLDGLTTGTTQVLNELAKLKPAAYLGAGDYAYANTDARFSTVDGAIDAWFNQMQRVATVAPMMPSYGNHESLLGEPISSWLPRFATPTGHDGGRNYSFDIGDAHFVAVYAVHNTAPLDAATATWLENDLAAARAAGKRWLVPFMHVSSFADGANHPSNLALRAQLGPIFERNGVKVVLMAHDQAYQRSYPLVDVPATNRHTSESLRCYSMSDGVTWLTASPGGKLSNKNRDFTQFQTNPAPNWVAYRNNTRHHVSRLTFKADGGLRVDALGIKGDGSPVTLDDSFEYTSGTCSLA